MGRKKVEMKRIEDKSSRYATFSKRRSGLMKKARELSILCDVEVSLVIFSSRGKLYEFSSTDCFGKVLERYQRRRDEDKKYSRGTNNAENYDSDYVNLPPYPELLQTVQRCLEGPDIDQFSVSDLVQLEKQFDAALTLTRYRKTQLWMQSVSDLHEKEKMLKEENELLEREIAAMKKNVNGSNKAIRFTNTGNNNNEDGDNNLIEHSQRATLHLLR
ncbi:truncated transcription factor CAULIFLOWER A [Ziziphus jujuba]|uniref:Truncated transcription factor CAULIFLOWER A n=1 Tax=Ziziphus jujuba TaxID=326968 RepID=A0A6P4AFP3_ZIZJJ|nr:truncated transcription factor CAULIFLOWER A [Ziziphus jujuba]